MTKKETKNDSGDRFSQVQYRYRRLCSEIFCEPHKCGPTDSDDDDDDSEFQIHRKMLRRRHVRKEQKELARRRKELEEKERTCRESNENEKLDEASINASVQGGCSQIERSQHCPPFPIGISQNTAGSPPPPTTTTVDATFCSPDHKDDTLLSQRMIPNFSPIRSKKLPTRIFLTSAN